MSSIIFLLRGELNRNQKYGITASSLAASLLWILALHFSDLQGIGTLFPLLLFMDASLMSFLLVGVTLIFETQENVLKSFLVSPININHYLLAKTVAVVLSAVTTFILLTAYGLLFKNLGINILGMFLAVVVVAFAFAQLGLIMTYYSKDFTDLLIGMFKFSFLLAIPTILETLNVFTARWFTVLQYLNPTKHAMVLMQASASPVPRGDVYMAAVFLLVVSVGGFVLSRRLFDTYAVKGGGA